jgi:nitroreductase
MNALEAIRLRRSVRNFTPEPLPREHLEAIVDAGRLAATGYNHQPWEFIVVSGRDGIKRLSIVTQWIEKAGAVIVVVMDPSSEFWLEDGSAAIQSMLIAATALGYGSCWVQGEALQLEERLKGMLGIPNQLRILALVPVGIAKEWPTMEKKPLEEVIHWGRYGGEAIT